MAKKETIPTIIDTPEALTAKMAAMKEAQKIFATYTQEQVDKIFKAAATAADKMRIPLAKMAVEETGMGIMEDKVIKNHYAAEYVYNAYKNTQTCGVVDRTPITLRHGARHEPDAAFLCRFRQQTPCIAALRLGIFRKRGVAVWAAPHFRKYNQITAGCSSIAHISAHGFIIFSFGCRDRHLTQAKFHGIPAFA